MGSVLPIPLASLGAAAACWEWKLVLVVWCRWGNFLTGARRGGNDELTAFSICRTRASVLLRPARDRGMTVL